MQLRRLKLKTQGTEESSCMESNSETPTSPKPLQEKELFILRNKSVQYKFIGEGTFGKVAKCVNLKANENTAMKILKDVNDYAIEVQMLEKLRKLDTEKNNLVGFVDNFIVDDKSCIAFECLDRSLYDLMEQREAPLTPNEIRPITRQLLVALNALKGIGILHADVKLDNVMFPQNMDNSRTEESSSMESNSETPTSPKPLQEKELFILRNKSVQ
uniref:Protein kinase domain-containing protein n=1 Tax=Gasterosteus aculeatus aculeatus TaxID=481459 RepID=A0AAQ4Q4W7_GASAC